jgi:hypothetical protein
VVWCVTVVLPCVCNSVVDASKEKKERKKRVRAELAKIERFRGWMGGRWRVGKCRVSITTLSWM